MRRGFAMRPDNSILIRPAMARRDGHAATNDGLMVEQEGDGPALRIVE